MDKEQSQEKRIERKENWEAWYKSRRDGLTVEIGRLNLASEQNKVVSASVVEWSYRWIRELLDIVHEQSQDIKVFEEELEYLTSSLETLTKKIKKFEPTMTELTKYFERMKDHVNP